MQQRSQTLPAMLRVSSPPGRPTRLPPTHPPTHQCHSAKLTPPVRLLHQAGNSLAHVPLLCQQVAAEQGADLCRRACRQLAAAGERRQGIWLHKLLHLIQQALIVMVHCQLVRAVAGTAAAPKQLRAGSGKHGGVGEGQPRLALCPPARAYSAGRIGAVQTMRKLSEGGLFLCVPSKVQGAVHTLNPMKHGGQCAIGSFHHHH